MKKDQSVSLTRGCEIEVRPEGDGFEGAWFKAILEDSPGYTRKRKLSVRYEALEADDGSPLRESVYRRFIRPVPPENLFSTADFEEGSVVEAAHRDGWWGGLFVKKIGDDKHLVYSNSPADLIYFKRKQLRQHFDWTKGEWVRPQNKQLSNKCGTMVEVMEKGNGVVWVPAIIVKEMEDGKHFIVKYCKYLSWNDDIKPSRSVSSRNIRPVPPPSSVENYELKQPVEVFIEPEWRPGIVKAILCDKHYTVCLKATNELFVLTHSDLRPSKKSVSKRFMRISTEVNVAITPQRSLSPVENGEAAIPEGKSVALPDLLTKEPSLAQGSGNEMVDDVRNDSDTSDKAQGEASCEKESSEDNQRKRKREPNLSSTCGVEETQATDTVMVLPFAKKSPFWKTCETMEVFQKVPQSPHFSPLVETREDFREGSAFGMMLTFSRLMEELKDLETNVPMSQLDNLKDSFGELERHGFNVTTPLARINKLLALKERQLNIMEELNRFDSKKHKAEEEIREMETKILELHRQQNALKETAYQDICRMESCARDLGAELDDVEFEFERILSAPW